MNIRASLLAVVVLVIGLAGTVIIGIEKEYPIFTDLFGISTPRFALSSARIDSRIESDSRIVAGVIEIDLKRLQEVQAQAPRTEGAGTLIVELPNDTIILEAGIRIESKEFKASLKKLELPTQTINSKLVLDSVQWSLVGSNLVLVEFDPDEKAFTLWLRFAGFMAPDGPETAGLQFPRLVGFSPSSKGNLQSDSVLLDLSPEAISQTAGISSPNFSEARSAEQVSAGEGRSLSFARVMSAAELTDGLEISVTLDKSVNMIWVPIISTSESPAPEMPDSGAGSNPSSVLVARYSSPSSKVISNIAKVVPESFSETDFVRVDTAINGVLATGAAPAQTPLEVKLSRPKSACDEASAIVDAWQWAAAKVDSLVIWVPGPAGVPCPVEQLATILSSLTNDLGRAGGKPEIVVLPVHGGVERIREFSPWFSSVNGFRSGNFSRYHVEFATFARESLPLGPEVIIAPEILQVLWENSLSKGPELLTAGRSLVVVRP